MKKLLLLIIIISNFAFAQTHRFIYEMKYRPDSTNTALRTENMVLDVNPTEVKFYPYSIIEMDSLSKTDHPRMGWETNLPYVKRDRDSDKNYEYYLHDALFKITSTDKLVWKLLSDTKKADGYTLQKATTDFGGRHWTAWFSKDVPIPEGPYKFRGLPGMVFNVEDDRGNYFFKLLKSQNLPKTYDTSEFFENFAGMTAVPYTQKQYQKKLLAVYNDPWFDLKQEMMKDGSGNRQFYIYGTVVKDMGGFREVTINEQNRIRSENNPIEINKAVHYPAK